MSQYDQIKKHLENNKNTWLITGVAGFIGSNLLEKLLTLNQNVVGLDNFVTGYQHNIDQAIEDACLATGKNLKSNFRFIGGDIRKASDCNNACIGVDYVLHQAALGSVPRSIEDPINTNKANIDGFLNILVACKDAKIKRFVYAASSSTYGDHPKLPKVEENIGNPLSPYAVTKLVNELYAKVFANNYGFKSIGLRYFNIFGKRQDPKGAYAAVIPKWIGAILNKEDVFINGDGKNSRDFCFIDNAVQMNILAATTQDDDATDQIYNVALNHQTSLKELYQMIEEKISNQIYNIKMIQKKEPIYRESRKGDVLHSKADISKAKNLLNYQPNKNISQGLDEAIDWYIKSIITK